MIWVDDLVSNLKLQYCPHIINVGQLRWECHGRVKIEMIRQIHMSGQSRNYLFISSLHEFSQFNVVSMRAHEKGILLFDLALKNVRESDMNQQPSNRDAVEYRRAKNNRED